MKDKSEVVTNGRAVFYTVLWENFRQAALELGWTLALHGSMASDMDIIGVPWIEEAKPVSELIKALSACVGNTIWADSHFEKHIGKPHGRVVYTLAIFTDYYIDLSVFAPESLLV